MKELAETNLVLEERIVCLIEEGNACNSIGDYSSAIKSYQAAWDILPEPKLGWEMLSSWLSGSFYTVYFINRDYESAKAWAEAQLKSTDNANDTAPLIDLGMVYYELLSYKEAYEYFDAAYALGKERAFKERSKKYLDFYLNEKKKTTN